MAAIRYGHDFWARAVAEVEGGARVVDVARRLGVNAGTLAWWRRNLRQKREKQPVRTTFLPVVAAERAVAVAAVETLELTVGSVQIRVRVGTDVEYVAGLVRAINERC